MNGDRNTTLLIVDDEVTVLQTMTLIFQMQGYHVIKACNGQEAIIRLREQRKAGKEVDCVLTDLEMPVMAGLELVQVMRTEQFTMPVLVLTGQGSKNVIVELLREGANDYIEKPLNMEVLLGHVNRLLASENRKRTEAADRDALIRKQIDALKSSFEERLLASQEFQMLGKIASSIVHDFNNFITGILGCSEILSDMVAEDKNERYQKYINGIINTALAARDVAAQFEGFNKGSTEHFIALDMHKVIREAIKLVRVTLNEKAKVVINTAAMHVTVNGDRTLLINALVNLLLNAGDAITTRGEITIGSCNLPLPNQPAGPPGLLAVTVEDNGCGMSEEVQKNMFIPFFTTKGTKGNGIGLSSVLSIVERHQGAITVKSEVGKGTILTMVFPLVEGG